MNCTCRECGHNFVSSRYRATCSVLCARDRRRRQYREAARNRSPESRAKDAIRKSSREYRDRHAARERAARATHKRTVRRVEEDPAKRREYSRQWWATSPAAEKIRIRRNERRRLMLADPVEREKERFRLRQHARERRRRRALLDTTRIRK